jgi:excisionase family DNA binding protein
MEIFLMSTDLTRIIFPDERDVAAAAESSRLFNLLLSKTAGKVRIELVDSSHHREVIEPPAIALQLFREALQELAMGNAVEIHTIHNELNTQQSADLLNMSRSNLVDLLDRSVLPHTRNGRHRKIKLADLMAYKAQQDEESLKAMHDLAAQAQEKDMGY